LVKALQKEETDYPTSHFSANIWLPCHYSKFFFVPIHQKFSKAQVWVQKQIIAVLALALVPVIVLVIN